MFLKTVGLLLFRMDGSDNGTPYPLTSGPQAGVSGQNQGSQTNNNSKSTGDEQALLTGVLGLTLPHPHRSSSAPRTARGADVETLERIIEHVRKLKVKFTLEDKGRQVALHNSFKKFETALVEMYAQMKDSPW